MVAFCGAEEVLNMRLFVEKVPQSRPGGMVSVNDTLPLKPLIGVIVIVEVLGVPALVVIMLDGLAEIVKSALATAGAAWITVRCCDVSDRTWLKDSLVRTATPNPMKQNNARIATVLLIATCSLVTACALLI
jgi:hypothetical protein